MLLALGSPLGLAHADEVALPTVKVSGQSESDDIKVDRLSSGSTPFPRTVVKRYQVRTLTGGGSRLLRPKSRRLPSFPLKTVSDSLSYTIIEPR